MFLLDMTLQCIVTRVRRPTNLAHVLQVVTVVLVRQDVPLQFEHGGKRPIALAARKRFCVVVLVAGQLNNSFDASRTVAALVRSIIRVDQHVSIENYRSFVAKNKRYGNV